MIEPWLFMNWKKTAEYLLTSQTLTAAEALEAGIINRVVPPGGSREDHRGIGGDAVTEVVSRVAPLVVKAGRYGTTSLVPKAR